MIILNLKMFFEEIKTCKNSNARISMMQFEKQNIKLPIFMPVATHGILKASHFKVRDIILGNTFHLRSLNADLKEYMGINACLTDSGGFQIISLQNEINEDGVIFTDYDHLGQIIGKKKKIFPTITIGKNDYISNSELNFSTEDTKYQKNDIYNQETNKLEKSESDFSFCNNVYCFDENCDGCIFEISQKFKYLEKYKNFQSKYEKYFLSPEKSIEIQNRLNSDIAMQLDDVIRPESDSNRHVIAVKRSIRWLDRLLEANKNQDQAIFPIVQGGLNNKLRMFSVNEILKRAKNKSIKGIAIGGLCGGEDKKSFCDVIFRTSKYIKERFSGPIYVMGVGYPEDVLVSICLGSDMSDCVYPTRTARFGKIFTDYGDINVSRFLNNFTNNKNIYQKFDNLHYNRCECRTCRVHSLEFLQQIRKTPNFCILLTEHNLFYMQNLTDRIQKAIEENTLLDFLLEWANKKYSGNLPAWIKYAIDLLNER